MDAVVDVITFSYALKAAKSIESPEEIREETAAETNPTAGTTIDAGNGSRKKTAAARGRRRISKDEADSIMAAFKDSLQ